MYTVVGFPVTRALRVLWALEELEQPYQLQPHFPASAEARAVNPSGKIPVLLDGDVKLTDSTAIMMYLADKHGGLLGAPGTLERARQVEMSCRLLDEMDAVLWVNARHQSILPKDKRVPQIHDTVAWELARNFDRLADDMTSPFVAGEAFSIADIIFTHCVAWAKHASITIENKKILAHAKAMRERPAFQRLLPVLK